MNWQTWTVMTVTLAITAAPSRGSEPSPTGDVQLTSFHDATYCDCGCDCCPDYEFSAGYLLMAREYGANSAIVTRVNTGATDIGLSNFEGDFDSGFELSGRWSRLEARYLQISSGAQERAVASGGDEVTFLGDDYFSTLDIAYDTDLHSGEINLFCNDPCATVRVTTGFRYVNLSEDLTGSFPGFTGEIFTRTRNNLYGLQLGVDADLWRRPCSRFSLVATSKAGVFLNKARLDSLPNAAAAVTLGSTADGFNGGSFIGELGLLARAEVNDHVVVDAGYNLMLITGVAIAGDQTSAIDMQPLQPATSSIQSGDVMYHGLTARATVSF